MSMNAPLDPFPSNPDDGIPAADPGAGAPQTADGFGAEGEEPAAPEQGSDDAEAAPPTETAFQTPDPDDVGRGPVTP
ncbi:hypothetical protein O2W18_12625 [Modestobacter sp. VKM Ac-2983]|uniref:hypothetical protein n=1 Tax=Modestobacter sp. VKM Ac-2983 TaxID=3004137 RepID=UPI0022ABB530|nr:hypothetical protein [Modestobacter sp. VKM Ac-2983]MCZ2805954.1 hypothetical protein [Modestobacter sp. VKM Ac-2983]